MDDGRPGASRLLVAARLLFLVAVVVFAVVGLRRQWPQITVALGELQPSQVLLAGVLFLLGVATTGPTWTLSLRGYRHRLGLTEALRIFFVGQLGKYIPGSVWSFAAQAQMGVQRLVPARTTVAAGLVFLVINLASAAVVGGVAMAAGQLAPDVPLWAGLIAVGTGLVCLSRPVLQRLATALASEAWGTRRYGVLMTAISGWCLATWGLYGAATAALLPPESAPSLLVCAGAFALAYIAGVVVIIAPAGVGVRELLLTALLAPSVGLGPATVTALSTRVLITVADFAAAGLAVVAHRFRVRSRRP